MVSLTGDRQASTRLLDAVISVSRELRVREVLQLIVSYACDLTEASYGAIGVAGPDQGLVDVIYQGVDEAQREQIGHPPTGNGLLGELIQHPGPLRLADPTQHPRSVGFPPNHPAMHTFLGVPLLIRGEVFGNLYVTEKRGGAEFTAADEETLTALATAAAIAVENAQLYERSRQRERWLQASNEITAALLDQAQSTGELQLVTERARAVADAPVGAIALPHEKDPTRLEFKVVDGLGPATEKLVGETIDIATTASGMVFSSGEPLLLEQYGDRAAAWQDEHNSGAPELLLEFGSAAIVPLAAGEQILGVLLLIKLRGEQPFAEADLELLQNFAAHAALALQYAKARADQRRLAVVEDRDRIAGDMQDLVIRRLFDIGLSLQGMARLVPPEVRRRMSGLVDDLDGTIRDVRRSIFSLQDHMNPAGQARDTLDDAVLRMVTQAADALGFEPGVAINRPLEPVVPQRVRPDLLATVREALSNVARHAQAGAVSVTVHAGEGRLTLTVVDNGIGIAQDRARNSGLASLRRRAERWDGKMTVEPGGGGGTRLTWSIPIAES